MQVVYSTLQGYEEWLELAREVEHLFGPMAEDLIFQNALRQSILRKRAFCILKNAISPPLLAGGVIISKKANEIAWLAVRSGCRRKGYGEKLLKTAVDNLSPDRDIFVTTFEKSVEKGQAARKLYLKYGFIDHQEGDLNPAGIPTVIMRLKALSRR